MAKRSGTAHCFHPEYGTGDHWWSLFKKRHPELALRRADSLERSQTEALNPDIVKEYFDLFTSTYTQTTSYDDHGRFITATRCSYC